MSEITTNERFDRLTNLDISTHYRGREYWFMKSDFRAALAYWIVAQNPNKELIDVVPSVAAFDRYVNTFFKDSRIPEKFTYGSLREIVNDDVFENIPEILKLNRLKPDFIDLGALARNVFYMMLRESITQ